MPGHDPDRLDLRVVRVAPGAGDGASWAGAIATITPSERLKEEPGQSVQRAEMLGRQVVVKRIGAGSLWARVKMRAGWSRAARQWRGAEKLIAAGVPAARPLALVRGSGGEWLVIEYVEGRTLIDVLDRPPASVRAQHALAAAVGDQVGTIVSAGVFNRDHKPSNLIVSPGPGAPSVTVLDTVAIRRCPPGSVRRAAQMLASLHIEPTGLACPARVALRARVVRRAAAIILARAGAGPARGAHRLIERLLWSTAGAMVGSHADPRPTVDPRRPPRV